MIFIRRLCWVFLCRWAERDNAETCSEDEFRKVVNSCSNDEFYEFLYRSSRESKGMKYTVKNLAACLFCDTDLCSVFFSYTHSRSWKERQNETGRS